MRQAERERSHVRSWSDCVPAISSTNPVYAHRLPALDFLMNEHRIVRSHLEGRIDISSSRPNAHYATRGLLPDPHVNTAHKDARQVGTDGYHGEVEGPQQFADLLECLGGEEGEVVSEANFIRAQRSARHVQGKRAGRPLLPSTCCVSVLHEDQSSSNNTAGHTAACQTRLARQHEPAAIWQTHITSEPHVRTSSSCLFASAIQCEPSP